MKPRPHGPQCRARIAIVTVAGVLSLFLSGGISAQSTPVTAQPQDLPTDGAPQLLAELVARVRALHGEEAMLEEQREAAARNELQRRERLAREALVRRDAAEARSMALDTQWQRNETRIGALNMLLVQHQGNLGELFGVTRQVAGDAANVLQQSLLTPQYVARDAARGEAEERTEFLRRIGGATALPSIAELERLWYELHREMTDAGKVVRFEVEVLPAGGSNEPVRSEVVRVGPFTAVAGGDYLGYLPSRKSFVMLRGRLEGTFRAVAERLERAPADQGYAQAVVDPARGTLIGRYLARPSVLERIQHGKAVGYVIVAVGIIGAVAGLYQLAYLMLTGLAVKAQLRRLHQPRPDNPLGRVLLASRRAGAAHENVELARLRISEAVLRETPGLERMQSFLRLAVSAGPLLGLIGTVIGMIITFNAITASGSSDPKLMAQGIGQAMIATVLGLGIAIPLLFLNAALAARSRAVTQVLDEQSHAVLAAHADTRTGAV